MPCRLSFPQQTTVIAEFSQKLQNCNQALITPLTRPRLMALYKCTLVDWLNGCLITQLCKFVDFKQKLHKFRKTMFFLVNNKWEIITRNSAIADKPQFQFTDFLRSMQHNISIYWSVIDRFEGLWNLWAVVLSFRT